MGRIEEQICRAIDLVAQKRIQELEFDKTIRGTIISLVSAEEGKYLVKYQDSELEAYSSSLNIEYSTGESVYITIPRSDFSEKKMIYRASGPEGELAHSSLTGLSVGDDHPQYLKSTSAATTYAPIAKGVTNGNSHNHYGGDGAQISHGDLIDLSLDNHTQYHNNTRGDARYAAIAHATANDNPHGVTLAQVGGTLDHTGLSNIGSNSHAAIDSHIGDADRHLYSTYVAFPSTSSFTFTATDATNSVQKDVASVTLAVPTAGTYLLLTSFAARMTTGATSFTFRLKIDGAQITGNESILNLDANSYRRGTASIVGVQYISAGNRAATITLEAEDACAVSLLSGGEIVAIRLT